MRELRAIGLHAVTPCRVGAAKETVPFLEQGQQQHHNWAHYTVEFVGEAKTLAALLTLVLLLSVVEGDDTWHRKPFAFGVSSMYGVLMLWGRYVYAHRVPYAVRTNQWAERANEKTAFFYDTYVRLWCWTPETWALFEHCGIVAWYALFAFLGAWCALLHEHRPDPLSAESAAERLLALALRLQLCACTFGTIAFFYAFFVY